MTRHALLNNVAHRDLKVITRHAAEFGDNVGSVVTFPTEYGDIQREYPILFRKEAGTGDFLSVALLGFATGENLFLEEGRWNARYIPGVLARGPFLIGFQERASQGEVRSEPVVHIDLDHPRVSTTEGEPLFLENGGRTRYLDRVATILNGLGAGIEVSKLMFTAFMSLDLIEPVKVTVTMSPEEQHVLQGYYTINEDKLAALDGEALVRLNRSGFLQAAFMVVASLNNVKTLIDLKHRRRRAAAA